MLIHLLFFFNFFFTPLQLEVPHINVMTKVDILSEAAKAALEDYTNPANYERVESKTAFGKRYKSLVDNLFK